VKTAHLPELLIDSHLHLDDRCKGTAREAVRLLKSEMTEAGLTHAVVLHLLSQRWSIEEVAQALRGSPQLTGFANVDPKSITPLRDIDHAVELGFRGLKLHPRLQKYQLHDSACVAVLQRAGEVNFPVVIDCFPDGDWLMAGLSVVQYAELAKAAPNTYLIVAHAGGHHCLDLLMLMKRVPNLWIDLSYSLLYYDSPVIDALFYCMKSLRYDRVLFGTDYPDRSLPVSVKASLELFDRFGVVGEPREKVLWKNAQHLLRTPSALQPTITRS
jgi:predicted TIM-barrel fold metal-dependent hydrolase